MYRHAERHRGGRAGWLRAAILGADDGILSTASLLLGVGAAGAARAALLVAGLAGLVAGAMAMAIGEYVSVSSQSDIEAADRAREARELAANPDAELAELAGLYEARGLAPDLARQVAAALHAHDPLVAHLRAELGQFATSAARPLQAGAASAASFALGAALPLGVVAAAPASGRGVFLVGTALLALFALGGVGAAFGGAPRSRAMLRVGIGGACAMAATAGIGHLFGAAVH